MVKTYNKLVRDKIPEIIEKSGNKCVINILNDNEYLKKLDEKINEELLEFREGYSLEELCDLLEVLHAIAKVKGYSLEDIKKARLKKNEERGAFDKKILLKEVIEQG